MKPLAREAMHDVYEIALRVNELIAGYDYLLSVVQAAEPHAIADVAELRKENDMLRADNERLQACTWALEAFGETEKAKE